MNETLAVTKQQIVTAIQFAAAIGDAIRELKQVPAGKLYAVILGAKPSLTATVFNSAIAVLEKAQLVKREVGMLVWIGEGEASLSALETIVKA